MMSYNNVMLSLRNARRILAVAATVSLGASTTTHAASPNDPQFGSYRQFYSLLVSTRPSNFPNVRAEGAGTVPRSAVNSLLASRANEKVTRNLLKELDQQRHRFVKREFQLVNKLETGKITRPDFSRKHMALVTSFQQHRAILKGQLRGGLPPITPSR
jgi:hypothetical protein